jgi:hypothetical protein
MDEEPLSVSMSMTASCAEADVELLFGIPTHIDKASARQARHPRHITVEGKEVYTTPRVPTCTDIVACHPSKRL